MAHLHEVVDTDLLFFIDGKTMEITTKSDKLTLRQGDHNSEIFTFSMPRYIEKHDTMLCNLVTVHYNNSDNDRYDPKTSKDYYTVEDLRISEEDEDTVLFSRIIDGAATEYVGTLTFSVRFECLGSDGKCEYAKNTELFDGITVKEAHYNTDSLITAHSDFVGRMETLATDALEKIGKYDENIAELVKSIPFLTVCEGVIYVVLWWSAIFTLKKMCMQNFTD